VNDARGLVLVAWDGSDQARRALLHTVRVVGPGQEVAVINVVPARAVGARLETVSDEELAEQRSSLEHAATLLAGEGVRARLIAASGDPAFEIPAAAARLGADTVVVGRSRRRRLHRKIADRLVRGGRTDVLVVP
jgi:nucleotide-binding universal stress UspA family protein